jgi:hypothetical protein
MLQDYAKIGPNNQTRMIPNVKIVHDMVTDARDGSVYFCAEAVARAGRADLATRGKISVETVINEGLREFALKPGLNVDGSRVIPWADLQREREKAEQDNVNAALPEGFSLAWIQKAKSYFCGDRNRDVIEPYWEITVSSPSGKTYNFTDTYVFDFGRVINPVRGGLAREIEGQWYWITNDGQEPIEAEELEAYRIVEQHGRITR